MTTHIYNLTISSVSPEKVANYLASLPERLKTSPYGTHTCDYNGQEAGSARVSFYLMTPKNADILRKRFQRKFGARAKFARLVTQRVKVESIPTAPADPAPTPTTTNIG